jgi:peptide/nickel transport system substrate-binding protein
MRRQTSHSKIWWRRGPVLAMVAGMLVVGAIAVVIVAATAAANSSSSQQVFRLGTTWGLNSPNVFEGSTEDAAAVYSYVYPRLLTYDAQQRFIPDFAASWKETNGGRTWTFTTIAGAKWSDGQPLTAADVAFTFNLIWKYRNGPAAFSNLPASLPNFASVRTPSPTTVVVNYTRAPAYTDELADMATIPILPQHIWSKHIGAAGKGIDSYVPAMPMVSGGPFMITNWVEGSYTIMRPNPYYYGPKPKIAEFGLQIFSDPTAMVEALETHQVDAIEYVPTGVVAQLKKVPGITVVSTPGYEEECIFINLNPAMPDNRALLIPKVREALDLAVPRAQDVKIVEDGQAELGNSIVPPGAGSEFSNPNLKAPAQNIAQANAILNSLGFKTGPNGVRIANGHPMSYTVETPTSDPGINLRFELLQEAFAKIGVKLTQKPGAGSAWFAAVSAPNGEGLYWDLALGQNTLSGPDPVGLWTEVTCPPANFEHFCAPDAGAAQINATYDKLVVAPTAADHAADLYQLESEISSDQAVIVTDYLNFIEARWSTWTGFTESGAGSFNPMELNTLTSIHNR